MKSDIQILQELAKQTNTLHELSEAESKQLKAVLLDMYKDVAALCEQHHLTMMLCGGSALGAIRHQGFIPWDDDLDILMPRPDYERLIALLKDGALGNDYEYNTPNAKTDCKNVWLKIYRKGTESIDVYTPQDAPFPKGIYLDVFALDGVPSSRLGQQIKGLIANGLQFCSILTLYAQYPNDLLKQMMSADKQALRRYKFKVALGSILKIIPHRHWVWWFDQWVKDENMTGKIGIPTGREYYCGEIFDKDVYLPPTLATFEGEQVLVPNQIDRYLTNLYHNYMQLPPIEKRERHMICKLQFNKEK